MPDTPSVMRLSARDYFQMVTTLLFILLGSVILARSAVNEGPLQAYVIGVMFVAYGLYRLRLIRAQLALRSKLR